MTANSNLLCFSQAVKGCYEYPSSAAIIVPENYVNTLLQSTINAAKNDIYNLINTTALPRGKRHIDHPLMGGFVRLAFHDCVGGCDGCNGCIDHNNRDNGGLPRYTSLLDPICDKYKRNVTSRLLDVGSSNRKWTCTEKGNDILRYQ